jgi:hypothetical protein
VKAKLVKPLVAIAAVVGLAAMPLSAGAATPRTLWVAPAPIISSSISSATAGTSCATATFHTIQSAINAAAPGATINICAGTYVEQLTITQSVSLIAQGAVTVQLPPAPANGTTACDAANVTAGYQPDQSGIVICAAATVNIQGLTVDAAWPGSTCYDSLWGILVGGGATLNFVKSSVTAAGAVPLNGCQGGVGVQVGMAWTTPVEVGHANLLNDSVSGYQKNGITVDGTGSTANIAATTVAGIGATAQIAQNGIQISNGAQGTIVGAKVTGNECNYNAPVTCGPDGFNNVQSAGVLFYGAAAGSSISASTISGNDMGVYSDDTSPTAPTSPNVSILGDTLANRYEGVVLDQGLTEIDGDSFSGGEAGIDVLQYSAQSYAPNGSASLDTFRGASIAAVAVESDQSPGDFAGTLTVRLSDLRGNAARVVNNSLNYRVLQQFDL